MAPDALGANVVAAFLANLDISLSKSTSFAPVVVSSVGGVDVKMMNSSRVVLKKKMSGRRSVKASPLRK